MTDYRRPPITEAVVELLFAEPIEFSTVEKAAARFAPLYPVSETDYEVSAEFGPGGARALPMAPVAARLSSRTRSELFLIRRAGYLFSQLPPYPGWEEFIGRARRDYSRAKDVVGPRKLRRIGIRYINRIDVPESRVPIMRVDRILTVPLRELPFGPPGADGFLTQIDKDLGQDGCRVRVVTASVEPVVPNTWAVLLDLDIYKTVDLPTRDDDLWKLIESIRAAKNRVFEAMITDDARELFNR